MLTEAPALRGSHTMCTLNICKLNSACAVMFCRGRDRGREGRRRRGGEGHVAAVPPCQRSGRTGPGARERKDRSSLLLLAATAPASPA